MSLYFSVCNDLVCSNHVCRPFVVGILLILVALCLLPIYSSICLIELIIRRLAPPTSSAGRYRAGRLRRLRVSLAVGNFKQRSKQFNIIITSAHITLNVNSNILLTVGLHEPISSYLSVTRRLGIWEPGTSIAIIRTLSHIYNHLLFCL